MKNVTKWLKNKKTNLGATKALVRTLQILFFYRDLLLRLDVLEFSMPFIITHRKGATCFGGRKAQFEGAVDIQYNQLVNIVSLHQKSCC